MMNKKLVIAGNNDQAMSWIKQDLNKRYPSNTSLSLSDYIIVHRPEQLRGLRNPTGIFVGTWKDRHDLIDILHTLFANTDPNQPAHSIIGNLLTERMK